MRTALIAWDYPPAPSGLSTAAREIAESLAGQGCEVSVFTLDRSGVEAAGAVRVIGCGGEVRAGTALARLRLHGGAGHLAAPLAFRRAVLAEHARAPFAVVEATNWYAPAALLAGQGGFALVTRHSTPAAFSREAPATFRDRLDGWAADRLERRQARRSTALISNTADHGRRMAALYGPDRGRPHAVIGLSLPPAMLARAGGAPYPGEAGAVQILFVGRAEHRKGFDMLMEAAALLAEEAARGAIPEFGLTLVGVEPQDLPAGLPPAARARIEARGREPEAVLARRYEAAHIVAAPSRYESFGLVYQEAIAYGRPLVACALDASARQFVGDTGAGRMAGEASGQALAAAMRPLVVSDAERLAVREKALAAAGRFTRGTLGRETLALYEQALAQPR
ncbi:glycosyltransferase family 4 protein [Aureimonas populi]|uniref:Glycosyltransferase family 4 protein n=1 Tax=Aureimonas populi TaxID=1701758 RepID=A0ABW5CJ21_9HYPH|nr:glycosyltransferase family 4 protein [Aureimonas populi]